MTEERKIEIISLLGRIATLHIATDEMEQRGIKYSEVMEFLSELSYPDDTFKRKMAELAAKYNISHKRDIDWHNFVAEVEELTHPELAESEDERIIKFLKHAATLDAADELFQEYGVKHTQVIAWLESQKEQEQTEVDLEQEVISYFQGMWPGIDANTTMSFTPPAIMRLVKHFYELGKAAKPKVMQEVSDNVDKLRAISTPAEEDWFKIAEEWEKEDKDDHASDH